MTKNVSALARYGARMRPNASSFSLSIAPTRTGTMDISFPNPTIRKEISIVPVLVGAIDKEKEEAFGRILAPYLASAVTFFVISSDFCHWGTRFSYTLYYPQYPPE